MLSEHEQRVINQIVAQMMVNPEMKPKEAFESIKIDDNDVVYMMDNEISPNDLIIAAGMLYSFGPGLNEKFKTTVNAFSKDLPTKVVKRENLSGASISISGSIVNRTDKSSSYNGKTDSYLSFDDSEKTVSFIFDEVAESYAIGYEFDERVRQCVLMAPQIIKYIIRHGSKGAIKIPIPFYPDQYFNIKITGAYDIDHPEDEKTAYITSVLIEANLKLGSYNQNGSYVCNGSYDTSCSLTQYGNSKKHVITSNNIHLESHEKNKFSKREGKIFIRHVSDNSKNVVNDSLSRDATDVIIDNGSPNFKGRTYAERYFNDFLEMTEKNSPFITMGTVPISSTDHKEILSTIENAVKRKVKSLKANDVNDWRHICFIVPIAFDRSLYKLDKTCDKELSNIAERFAYAGVDEDLPINYIFVAQ